MSNEREATSANDATAQDPAVSGRSEDFMVFDDGMEKRRYAVDVAEEIIDACDKYGLAAKHSTTILTRQTLKALTGQVKHLSGQVESARDILEDVKPYIASHVKSPNGTFASLLTRLDIFLAMTDVVSLEDETPKGDA